MAEQEKQGAATAAEAQAIDLGEFSDLLEKDFRVKEDESAKLQKLVQNLALAATERSGAPTMESALAPLVSRRFTSTAAAFCHPMSLAADFLPTPTTSTRAASLNSGARISSVWPAPPLNEPAEIARRIADSAALSRLAANSTPLSPSKAR